MPNKKLDNLKNILMQMNSVLVAFSGGVDSTFLLKVAHDVLDENVLAVTASSETYPNWEFEEAKELAESLGANHQVIETSELSNPDFSKNPPDRCYYCKTELFSKLKEIATDDNINWVADGSTVDDEDDFRPGRKAAKELGVKSPLLEAGFSKDEIRKTSKLLDLPTWDKPSFACLASRFPYGTELNKKDLMRVEQAEDVIRDIGVKQVRVRHHQDVARIEVGQDEVNKFIESGIREKVVDELKALGYFYVSLDLAGYRSGSLNDVLPPERKIL